MADQAHNLKVAGSNPAPETTFFSNNINKLWTLKNSESIPHFPNGKQMESQKPSLGGSW